MGRFLGLGISGGGGNRGRFGGMDRAFRYAWRMAERLKRIEIDEIGSVSPLILSQNRLRELGRAYPVDGRSTFSSEELCRGVCFDGR